jgi:pilus assembly protein CpaE
VHDALNQALAVFMAPKGGDSDSARRHISTAVVGTRGGVGASTLATSLAWLFSEAHKAPTALLDLDVHFGTGALALDLEPGRGLTDAIENPSRIDPLFIERAMVRANDNLSILSAEAPISQPLMTDGAAFVQLEDEFRQAFEMTVIDLPRNMLINFPHLLADVNVVIVVTELTLAGARDAIRLLSWLKTYAKHADTIVVANKVHSGVGEISKSDFEASIERKLDYSVPYDIKAAANAAKLGQTFVAANRSTKAGVVLRDLGTAIVATSSDSLEAGVSGKSKDKGKPAAEGGKTSLLGSFSLKKMLPAGKPKAGTPA